MMRIPAFFAFTLARNHQFLGVNRAIEAIENRHHLQGKLGVFWHTQGSGKSYSMVFFTRKVHRKLGGNFTFLICTDRDDLDTQIYKTFAGCKLVDNDKDPCRASSGKFLSELLAQHKAYIFTLIQKFNQEVEPDKGYTLRDDIIVITDEAHITEIIMKLHEVVDEAIETKPDRVEDPERLFDISQIDFDRLRREFSRIQTKRTTVQNLKQAVEKRLHRLMMQNPLRTDFQRHYEEIVAEYNREKDRVTIEKTFEDLLKFISELEEEESRAIREGLDEESLAMFDVLKKPNLAQGDINRIKQVALELLVTLKAEKLKVDHWRDKETTRDAVHVAIRDFLWSDDTGLPIHSYSENEVNSKSEEVFRHVYWAYPTLPSPYYAQMAA